MAIGFCSGLQEPLSLQVQTYNAAGSCDTHNGTRRCDELIIQLCDWVIPRKTVKLSSDGHQRTYVNKYVPTPGNCSNEDSTLHPYKIIETNFDEPQQSLKQNAQVERTGASSPIKTDAAAIRSGHEDEINYTTVIQAGDVINSHCKDENEPSFGSQNGKIGDSRMQNPVKTRFTSMFGSGSTAPCCRQEQTERTPTCAVEGAGFCLGSLSMINHCTQFGGGPGIDRDGAQVFGKFCGIGARYKRGEISPPDNWRESHGTLEPGDSTEASNLSSIRMAIDPDMYEEFALEKQLHFTGINLRLREMVSALDIVRIFVLPRVPGLAGKVLHAMDEFTGHVVQLIDSGSLDDNVVNFKRSMAGVILNFDANEFLKILKFSDDEVMISLPNTLKKWNEVSRSYLEMYVVGPDCRAHEENRSLLCT